MDFIGMKQHMYDVVGALHEVHHELGPGLNELCYQEGLRLELAERGIPFCHEQSFHPTYHGHPMDATYRPDFICKESIVVECKSVSELTNNHRAQLFNYMRLLQAPCGILVNFAPQFAAIERYLLDTLAQKILTIEGQPLRTLS